jgi:hypothetical protein
MRADSDTDLDARPEARGVKQNKSICSALGVTVTNFSHISLYETAFEVFAVRVSGAAEIGFERDQDFCTHLFAILTCG